MGERERAKAMARRNIDAFEQVEVDAILTNAAGCGAMMKEYGDLLQDDAAYAERARRFSIKVRDVTEFLVELPFTPPNGRIEAVATYQDPCHLAHAQGVRQPPRRILASIPGLRFAEMADADHCCGSAGIYNMVHPDIAAELLEKKLAAAMATGADIIVSANPGCMLQLTQGLARLNRRVRLVHVIDLLDEAYRRGHSPM
jgi:glycolate oxidase iron-sulfur subunit